MRKNKILIIDDSETQLIYLQNILEKNGWEVISASSGEDALKLLLEIRPDLIITDLNLPGIKGDEFCKRVKINITTRTIPILILTVMDKKESVMHGFDSGADDYIAKYEDEDVLILRIKKLLSKAPDVSEVGYKEDCSFFSRSNILAVDDSITYLEFLKESLALDGLHIKTTTNPLDVLDIIEKEKIDCVLVDLEMPKLDGIELCKKILGYRKDNSLPLVTLMLTAHEDKELMTKALEAGADDFVGKSNDISIIKARLTALLRRKFILDDNQRILQELQREKFEAEKSRLESENSIARARLADRLEKVVSELEIEIKKRQAAEGKLQKYAKELEKTNDELKIFSYAASHDLKEPLRTISGFLKIIQEDYSEKIGDEGKDYFKFVIDGAERMSSLINDLLSYVNISSSALMTKDADLTTVLKIAVMNLENLIKSNNAQINYDELPKIMGNEQQLVLVFQNIIINAIKYKRELPPTINISYKQVSFKELDLPWKETIIGASDEDFGYIIEFQDNGMGINKKYWKKIFESFSRLHNKSKIQGTGLGLSITQKIIHYHKGLIWVESQEGKGSCFKIFFPAQK